MLCSSLPHSQGPHWWIWGRARGGGLFGRQQGGNPAAGVVAALPPAWHWPSMPVQAVLHNLPGRTNKLGGRHVCVAHVQGMPGARHTRVVVPLCSNPMRIPVRLGYAGAAPPHPGCTQLGWPTDDTLTATGRPLFKTMRCAR